MKDKRKKQKEKTKAIFEKLIEKKERIENIRKSQEKNRKKLEKALNKASIRQKEILDKNKENKFNKIVETRNQLYNDAQKRKRELQNEEELRREDILFQENNKIGKLYNSQAVGKREASNIQKIQAKTLVLSKEDYELRKDFLKKMSKLKSESVSNKSQKERRKLYLDKLRIEAEKRKKEEEERLEKLQMG